MAISFPEGTTFRYRFTLVDQNGAAINLTGASLTWAAYPAGTAKTGAPVAFLTKTVGSGITVISAPAGTIELAFTPVQTVDKAGSYPWELELVEAGGDTWLAGSGTMRISPARYLDA